MITLPIDLAELEELKELETMIREDPEGACQHLFDRSIVLRESLVPALTGFVAELMEAGLLTVSVENHRTLKKCYRSVQYDVAAVGDNGNIWLVCEQSCGHSPSVAFNGHPNIGRFAAFSEYCRESHRLAKGPKKPYKIWLAENQDLMQKRFDEYHESLADKPRPKLMPVSTT